MGSEYSWAVDALVIALVVVSAYLAMVRGFFREMFALASWVIAFFAALILAPQAYPHMTDLPFLGGLVRDCSLGMLVAFIIVFGAALIISGIIIWLFSSGANHYSAVSVIDQLLGLVYGAVRGLVLVAALLIGYDAFNNAEKFDVIESAATYPYVRGAADLILEHQPSDLVEWVEERARNEIKDCESKQSGGLGA